MYHDRECQREHHPTHKAACIPPFRVQEMEGRGKCLFAAKPFDMGEKLSFQAFVPPVLIEACRPHYCAYCFTKLEKSRHVLDCDDRLLVILCSPACHDAAKLHLVEVAPIAFLSKKPQGRRGPPKFLPAALLVYRLLSAMAMKKVAWSDIDALQGHVDAREDAQQHETAIIMTMAALFTSGEKSSEILQFDTRAVQTVLSKLKFNAFTICDSDNKSLGFGLYKTAHSINHSCVPNALQDFLFRDNEPPQLVIQMDTSIQMGEEICISYLDNYQSFRQRQEQLKTDYFFVCSCPKCRSQQEE
jgi:hypothetical protein